MQAYREEKGEAGQMIEKMFADEQVPEKSEDRQNKYFWICKSENWKIKYDSDKSKA